MTLNEVMTQLEQFGNQQTKKTYINHGATEPLFGVKVGDLKKLVKKIKKNHELSLELFDTGNSDAMYLAGLIANEKQITKEQLNSWATRAPWYFISEYAVAWVAAESLFGWDLALDWIESDQEHMASSGWATLSSLLLIKPNEELDSKAISELLKRVEKEVHIVQNRVRYTMNGFVIAVGTCMPELLEQAKQVAATIGKVNVNVGKTSCKVPLATEYIQKVEDKGRVGYKKKHARC